MRHFIAWPIRIGSLEIATRAAATNARKSSTVHGAVRR